MPICLNCYKRSDCKEICKEVEALLPKPRSGGHRKEFSVDPSKIGEIYQRNEDRKSGWRNIPCHLRKDY